MTPKTTLAILIDRLGPPERLIEREVPLPDPSASEVHVAVHAAGVNFADLMMRMGLYGTVPPRPFSPGFEVAGEVARVGKAVTHVRPGDRVVALLRYGGYAHDVVIPARQVFSCPTDLSFADAAAVPVMFLTAWVALFEAAQVRKGETVLVLGAGGGVGTSAVQLAVGRGCLVLGTAGTVDKRAFVVDTLGAKACFDSRGDWFTEVHRLVGDRGIDVALDPVGGAATKQCRDLLAPLGRLVFYGLSDAVPGRARNWISAAKAWFRTPRFHPAKLTQPNIGVFGIHLLHLQAKEEVLLRALPQIYERILSGELHIVLDRTYPLTRDGAVAAHHLLHGRNNLGKVVLARPRG